MNIISYAIGKTLVSVPANHIVSVANPTVDEPSAMSDYQIIDGVLSELKSHGGWDAVIMPVSLPALTALNRLCNLAHRHLNS